MRPAVIGLLALAFTVPAGCDTQCPTALLEGTLVETPDGGLGVRSEAGGVSVVRWPGTYGIADDERGRKLVQFALIEAAREGDRIRAGGGMTADGDRFAVCGPFVVERAT